MELIAKRRAERVIESPPKVPALNGSSDLHIVQTKTLPRAVQDQLLQLILSNQLKMGEKLTEADLAIRLGVSRGPIREAFRGLEEAGLLQSNKNRGVIVRVISPEEGMHLYDLRSCLEAYAGRELAPKITKAQVSELRGILSGMKRSYDKQDVDEFYPLNIAFHDRIVEMVGNPKLLSTFRKMMNEIHLLSRHGIEEEGGRLVSSHEHVEIVDALAAGNARKAESLMRKHVIGSRDRFLLRKLRVASAE
ncbi:MAG: FCD domain-containing protein [Xanthobacteraceae bacterium]